jgi:protein-disulfide isomerase
MLRLLSISAVGILALNAATEKDIIKFVKRGLSSNPTIKKIVDVKVLEKQPVFRLPDWEAFIIEFTLTVKNRGKEANITNTDILFAKDRFVAPDLVDVKTNRSLKTRVVRSVDESFYDKEHHLLGSENAKHKIVVFSDPLCPFCREVVPRLFDVAKKHPDKFALYYYHMPIESLHPASIPLAKAIIFLKKKGDKKAIEKIYKTDFDYEQKDEKKVLKELEKKLNIKLSVKDINQKDIVNELKEDMQKAKKLMIRGTPTIFFDGKYDRTRDAYKKYIKSENETNSSNKRK